MNGKIICCYCPITIIRQCYCRASNVIKSPEEETWLLERKTRIGDNNTNSITGNDSTMIVNGDFIAENLHQWCKSADSESSNLTKRVITKQADSLDHNAGLHQETQTALPFSYHSWLTGSLIPISPAIGDAFKAIWGPEGRKDIWITNKLTKRIKVQLMYSKNVSETVDSESAIMFNKCSRDGLLGIMTYGCRITSESKQAKFFCYGGRAPRKDNKFDVREDGIYLIDEVGEHRICVWKADEVDHPGQQHPDSKSGNKKIY